MNMLRITTWGLAAFAMAAVLSGLSCRKPPAAPAGADSGFYEVMGTFAHVIAVAADEATAQKALDEARDELVRVDAMMSDYKPDSLLSQVNRRAAVEPVAVNEELFDLLQKSVEYSRRTDGAFDVTVGPLVDLWRQVGKENRPPMDEELEAASRCVGFDKLELNASDRTVRFAVGGMRLDLGGIAKGHAIDRAVQRMRDIGAIGGLVDIGGDLRCFGTPSRGRAHWGIGLQHPRQERGLLLKLRLNDRAVATSGDYRRFVVIDGRPHSHIVDPMRRNGAEGLTSVTILAPRALDADAMATAVSVMGAERGLQWVETQEGIEAILVESDTGRIVYSSGARRFVMP